MLPASNYQEDMRYTFFRFWGCPQTHKRNEPTGKGEQVYQFEVDVEYLIWRNTSVETKRKTKTHVFQILSIHPKNRWILQQRGE